MSQIHKIVDMWFDLLAYCKDRENFDMDAFKVKHDQYSGWHKKLDYEQQGHVTELIIEKFNERS